MKKYFVKLMSQFLYSTIHQVMLCSQCICYEVFLFSRKLCFLWSPCLLLIAESTNLDTYGKPTVGFFLNITSPSWIILSISLVYLIQLNYSRADDEISWNNFYFIVVKEFWYDKKVFWRIYLNIIFWILLWCDNFLEDLKFNIIVSTTLKYCYM